MGEFHPIVLRTIHAASEEARAGVEQGLVAFVHDNPGVRIKLESSGRLILSGEDELEIEAACERILQRHPVEIGELQIAYRETICKAAEGEGKYIRQVGGKGNYGHCKLRVEPNERGKGYEFINDIKGGVVPEEYIKPIDQGVQGALELGILDGFPIVDVKVTLFDGSYHDVDSNEVAFKFAGSIAFKEAAKKALPMLLEPAMAVEVTVPEEFIGAVIGDINSRRGRIVGMEHVAGSQEIHAIVPLVKLLRSSKRGRPSYAMRFAEYEAVPQSGGWDDDDAPVSSNRPNPRGPRSGAAAADPEL
jgi:elongation factor G